MSSLNNFSTDDVLNLSCSLFCFVAVARRFFLCKVAFFIVLVIDLVPFFVLLLYQHRVSLHTVDVAPHYTSSCMMSQTE